MEAITLIALVALMKKIVDTFKAITNARINTIVTQVLTWATGIFILWLATSADITSSLAIFGTTIGELDGGSIVLGGLIFSSTASVAYDYQAARDNADSAKTPSLIPNTVNEQKAV